MKCAFEGLTTALVIGIGASVTALLDFITYSSLLRKGCVFLLKMLYLFIVTYVADSGF